MPKKEDLAPGGQAVIEGVMMRSSDRLAIAVRLPNGKIKIKKDKLKKNRFKFYSWPFFRGVISLVQMLIVGMKALSWSANQSLDEDEELTKKEIVFMMVSGAFFALLFFVALPYVLTSFSGVKETSNPVFFNLIDGLIKIGLFVGYVWLISLMKDVKRLFEYHGAEHATVHCYESGKKLTVANCKKMHKEHERCGTSFIMIVFIVSVIVFSVLPVIVKMLYSGFDDLAFVFQKVVLFSVRILFIPVIASVAYEMLKLTAKFKGNIFLRLLIIPGILVQKITTKKPDDSQLEVAIKALTAVVK